MFICLAQGSRLFWKMRGSKNSPKSLKILAGSVSYDFSAENKHPHPKFIDFLLERWRIVLKNRISVKIYHEVLKNFADRQPFFQFFAGKSLCHPSPLIAEPCRRIRLRIRMRAQLQQISHLIMSSILVANEWPVVSLVKSHAHTWGMPKNQKLVSCKIDPLFRNEQSFSTLVYSRITQWKTWIYPQLHFHDFAHVNTGMPSLAGGPSFF